TSAKLTVKDWADGTSNAVAAFETSTGDRLLAGQVDSLIQAMAAFNPPPLGQTNLTVEQHQQLDLVIAATWKTT
ncbi:MAG: hypothetical protein H7840_18200, partial [Alphaproteobacteria bacterium]